MGVGLFRGSISSQEVPSTNMGLEAEIEAWEAASDEALEDFEDSILE